jgi:hypothetical protein
MSTHVVTHPDFLDEATKAALARADAEIHAADVENATPHIGVMQLLAEQPVGVAFRTDPSAFTEGLEVPEDNDLIEVRPQFAVNDLSSANWVVRKYHEAEDYLASVKDWAVKERKRAEAAMAFYKGRYGQELEQFTRSQIEGGRRKSLALPAGQIGLRNVPVRLEVKDEEALNHWALENLALALRLELTVEPKNNDELQEYLLWLSKAPQWIPDIVTTAKKSVVDTHFKATGEIPDGCDIVGGKEEFYIR